MKTDETKYVTFLYHRDEDGFGAAYAGWKKFGDSANFISVQYGEPIPKVPVETQRLFIVDFSYAEETLPTQRGLPARRST